jgi:hypothetical protein
VGPRSCGGGSFDIPVSVPESREGEERLRRQRKNIPAARAAKPARPPTAIPAAAPAPTFAGAAAVVVVGPGEVVIAAPPDPLFPFVDVPLPPPPPLAPPVTVTVDGPFGEVEDDAAAL